MRRAAGLVVVLSSSMALAQPKSPNKGTPAPPPTSPSTRERGPEPQSVHREGDYGGVDPEHPTATENRPHQSRKPAKGVLSWIGFEQKDGGADVFFQSVSQFDVTQTVQGGTLYVYLGGLNRLGANEWRAIDTRFFDNPLAKIEARVVGASGATKNAPAHKAGIEVRITFKNAKDAREATMKTATESDGMYYAYLAFPEGADAKEPSVKEPER